MTRKPVIPAYAYGSGTDVNRHWWRLLPTEQGTCLLLCDDWDGWEHAPVLDRAGATALIEALRKYLVNAPQERRGETQARLDPQGLADRWG